MKHSDPVVARAAADHILRREGHRTAGVVNPALLFLMSRKSGESQRVTRSALNKIAALAGYEDFMEADWAALDREGVFQIMAMLSKEGTSARYRNLCLSFVKGVAKEAFLVKQIDADVLRRIEMVKSEKVERLPKGRALVATEVKSVIEACQSQPGLIGFRDTAIIGLLFGCGLRRTEVASLDLSNLDLDKGELTVIGKGDKERCVPIPARTVELVSAWLAERGDWEGPLFVRIRKGDDLGSTRLTG